MGRLLQSYLAASLPVLQSIVAEDEEPTPTMPPGVEGIAQPEGATTFPMGAEPGPMQGQPISAMGEPTAPMGTMPPPGAGAGPQPSFGGGPTGAPTPSVPGPQVEDQPDRTAEFEKGENSFLGMADKYGEPEQINKAIDMQEEATGIPVDEQYAQLTKTEPYESEDDPEMKKGGEEKGKGAKLTRQEKGLILMEFGLSLMASSGTGEGTWASDIGQAGGAAISGHIGRKREREKSLAEAEERKQKARLREAQIKKAEKPKTSIKAVGGKLVIINEDTKEAEPVLMDGEPVDAENVDKYASEVDREAYETVVCQGLTGSEMKACKRRALAYSKGGAAKVAFPELEIADQRENVMDILQDPDNRSAKYPVASAGGKQIRWRDMTEAQRMEVRDALVEQRTMKPNVTTKDAKDTGGNGILDQISAEDRAKLQPGKIYTLNDGRKFKYVDGKAELVD
jgi:hypothetical protein